MMFILEYIRMVAYATIILTSLRGIAQRKFSSILFIGDILMAAVLLFGAILAKFGGVDRSITGNYILTPVVIIWALIHFRAILKPVDKSLIKE